MHGTDNFKTTTVRTLRSHGRRRQYHVKTWSLKGKPDLTKAMKAYWGVGVFGTGRW